MEADAVNQINQSGAEWGALASAVSIVISAAVAGAVLWFNNRQTRKQEADRVALDDAFKMVDQLRQEVKRISDESSETRKELRAAQLEHQQCQIRLARATGRIEHLEDALRRANIPFKPWVDTDTSEHIPLPPAGGK